MIKETATLLDETKRLNANMKTIVDKLEDLLRDLHPGDEKPEASEDDTESDENEEDEEDEKSEKDEKSEEDEEDEKSEEASESEADEEDEKSEEEAKAFPFNILNRIKGVLNLRTSAAEAVN
jgi:actin-related protein